MIRHEPFCAYQHTADSRDLRPVSCGACGEVWDRRHSSRDLSCWGLERGSAANGIANLAWLLVLVAAVVLTIVVAV